MVFVGSILVFQLSCKQANAGVEPNSSKPEPVKADSNAAPANSPYEPNGPPPVLKLESALHDFGDVGIKTTNICHFKFTNIGRGKLIIKNVRATCGCTVPAMQKQEYEPDESGSIEVRYTAGGDEGDVVKHLYIQSNDKQSPETELIIKAKIVAKVKFEPQLLKLSLKDQNGACPPIKLQSTDGMKFAVNRFEATANCLTADFDPNVTAAEFTIRPRVDAAALRKVLNGRISIGLNHPQCSEVFLNFEATPVYTLNPPMIMILKAKPNTAVTREVWVLNNYKEPFEIESVSSQKGLARLVSKEPHDNGFKLTVEIAPPVSQSKIKIFSDTIFINIKGGERLEINCRGFYERDLKKSK